MLFYFNSFVLPNKPDTACKNITISYYLQWTSGGTKRAAAKIK